MENVEEFSVITQENIGYYVYCLIDPRNNEIFYIGKGCGNRVFNHENEDLNNQKNVRIKDILDNGYKIKKYIIRHDLNKDMSFHIEAALIDILSSNIWKKRSLLNIMGGHHRTENGLKSVGEIEAHYGVEAIDKEDIKHNVLIININKSYSTEDDIYESTRKSWVLSEHKLKNIELVFSEYRGVFRKIYKPLKWKSVLDKNGKKRWMFNGIDISDEYPQYLNKKNGFKKQGQANPVQMVFGKD